MKHQGKKNNEFRPPVLTGLLVVALLLAAWRLFDWGRQGEGIASLVGLVCCGFAVNQTVKAVVDHSKLTRLRGSRKRYDRAANEHGRSAWATIDDVRQSDSLNTSHGFFLGQAIDSRGRATDVFNNEDENVLAVAPPKAGKTTCLVCPSGLANPAGSLVYIDPVAEGLSIMRPALEAAGYEVLVATPYPEKISQITGHPVEDIGLDFFSAIHAGINPNDFRELLNKSLSYHLRGKPEMTENERFFLHDGKTLHATFAAMTEIVEGRNPTMSGIRRQLMRGAGELSDVYQDAIDSDAFGGMYSEIGGALQGLLSKAGEQWAGGYGVAVQAFEAFTEGSRFAAHTNGSDFDPRILKDPDRKVALFVCHTLGNLMTNVDLMATTLTYLLGSTIDVCEELQGRLTIVVDEAGALYCPTLPDALLFYRKAVRMVLIYQDLFGQAIRTNGKSGVQQIISGCTWKIGMGIQDPETLEMFCRLCGTKGINDVGLNDREGSDRHDATLNASFSHKSVPLLRPEELRTWPADQMLAIGQNVPPLKLKKIPYYTRPEWARKAGRSPFAPKG